MVSRDALKKFVEQNGYDLVAKFEKGKWDYGIVSYLQKNLEGIKKGKPFDKESLAEIKKAFPTLQDAKTFLEPPKTGKTHREKNVEVFEETDEWLKIKQTFEHKPKTLDDYHNILYTAWRFLDKKPLNEWTGEDVQFLRSEAEKGKIRQLLKDRYTGREKEGVTWLSKHSGKMKLHVGNALRMSLQAINNYPNDIASALKDTPKSMGVMKERNLSSNALFTFIEAIDKLDILNFTWIGATQGNRISALSSNGLKRIDPNLSEEEAKKTDQYIYALNPRSFKHDPTLEMDVLHTYEPKVSKKSLGGWNDRPLTEPFAKLFQQYINDFYPTKEDQDCYLFPNSHNYYENEFKRISLKAGITFSQEIQHQWVSPHALKRTCASLMVEHRLNVDIIERITHTDWATLKIFYAKASSEAMKTAFGKPSNAKPWHQWLDEDLYPIIQRKYDDLKQKSIRTDGIVLTTRPRPVRKEPRKKPETRIFSYETLKSLSEQDSNLTQWAKNILEKEGVKKEYVVKR